MTRARGILALLAVLAATMFVPASAVAYGDAKGPPCSDYIVGDIGGFGYFVDPETGNGIVAGRNEVSKSACPKLDYRMFVLSADGSSTIGTAIGAANIAVGGQPVVEFMLDIGPTPPSAVCVYMTSERKGKVIDRAPDTGCEVVVVGTSPGGRGHG